MIEVKKGLILLISLLMLSCVVFGQHGNSRITDFKGNSVVDRLDVIGLDLARIKVENSSSILLTNFEKFQNLNENRFENCDNCSIELKSKTDLNLTEVKIQRRARFLFFNVIAEDKVSIDEDGSIQESRKNLWQWMYERNWIKVNGD